MRRFIFLTFLGGIATLAGHGVVSLGLHPYRLDSLAPLLQGCAVLVFGTAMFGSGSRWSTRDKRALLAGILWHRHGSGLAMTGILGCTAVLLRTSSTLFTFGLYSGIVASVVFAGVLSIRGMFRLSSAHVGMDMSNRHLSRLPNLLPPERARRSRRRRPDRATLFPGHIATRPNRGLERDKLRRQRPIGPFFG